MAVRPDLGPRNQVIADNLPKPPLPLRVYLQYFILARVPLLIAAVLFLLPTIALNWFPELLANLFVLGFGNIVWTMIASLMLAWSILVAIRVVLLNGRERFGIRQGLTEDVISGRDLVATELLALPILRAAVFSNGQVNGAGALWLRLLAAFVGIIGAHVLGFLVLFTAVLLSPRYPKGKPAEERFPLRWWLKDCIKWAYSHNVISPERREHWGLLGKRLPVCLRAGYFDPQTGLLYPGQWLACMMLFCSFLLYKVIGWQHLYLTTSFGVPAIGYIILLLIFLNWSLAILAFLFDRFRFPLVLAVLAFVFVSNLTSKSDHFYEIRAAPILPSISPAQVLASANRLAPDQDHPHGRIVVVATAGGGIQAAAWTAQVLTGLQAELHQRSPDQPIKFADSIALISSVSGGAVGTMFFVSHYGKNPQGEGFAASDTDLPSIVQMAEAPALDDVAWAMVYPDFSRVAFGLFKTSGNELIDRGWALEESWRRRADLNDTLGDWRQGVDKGWRPAVIFNSTVVESGEPLALATTDLQTRTSGGLGRKTLSELLPGYDLPVVTAVRLAASFPFVSPASRALWNKTEAQGLTTDLLSRLEENSKYHVVDGGYYDNYGVNSLLVWLDEAFASQPLGTAPDLLIIQIRSFPSEARSPDAKGRGWFYQAWAPLAALMRVRTTGQLVRDQEALASFRERWSAQGVHMGFATFEFQGDNAPLSWQMNPAQIQAITSQWEQRISGEDNRDWLEVNCFFRPHSPECAQPRPSKKGPW